MKKRDHMTHVFRGKRFLVEGSRTRKMRGWCEDPGSPDRVINIPSCGSSLDNLTTIIHEGLHACLWDTEEESVEETSSDIAHLLWRLGWRKGGR